jgi:hypothetical protein
MLPSATNVSSVRIGPQSGPVEAKFTPRTEGDWTRYDLSAPVVVNAGDCVLCHGLGTCQYVTGESSFRPVASFAVKACVFPNAYYDNSCNLLMKIVTE